MHKKILFINRQAPYGTSIAQEALDILLMASTFEQDISILFLGDGIWQLKKQQNPQKIGLKKFTAAYKALPLYDIKNIYVAVESFIKSGLTEQDLMTEVTLLSRQEIAELLTQQDAILSF